MTIKLTGGGNIPDYAFDNIPSLKKIIIPSGVTEIGNEAFVNTGLSSIIIPDSVETIGDYAFAKSQLTTLTIPSSVKTLGTYPVYGCTKLGSVTMPSNLALSGYDYYEEKSVGSDVSGGLSVTLTSSGSVPDWAFNNFINLTSITIPDGVKGIGEGAFAYTGLTSLAIPNSIESLGKRVVSMCYNLESLSMPSGFVLTGDDYYEDYSDYIGSASEGISITLTTTADIPDYAFNNINNLKSITIPNGIRNIGESAFGGCSGLTQLNIPNSVKNIGQYAFSSTGITSLTVPNGVETVGEYIVDNCSNLKSLTIPSVVGYSQLGYIDFSSLNTINYAGTKANWITTMGYDEYEGTEDDKINSWKSESGFNGTINFNYQY